MISTKEGKIIKGLGGLYEVRTTGGERLFCRAKGVLKRGEEKLFVGDEVILTLDDSTPDGIVISEVLERKSALIRPPLANLDYLFIVLSARRPSPVTETVDKLSAIAEHNGIETVIVITKSDLGEELAREYETVYRTAGFDTFVTSSDLGEGVSELAEYIRKRIVFGKTAAFAGASGVGKSTLMNALFPSLALATSEISKRIERGRHTTRHVELYEIDGTPDTGFLADTPGFSLIDFARFDFFKLDELSAAFRDISPYVGKCRYADCAHVGESSEECAVARAALSGKIPQSRLDSYRSIYKILKEKSSY